MNIQILQESGLTFNESKVYLALLELGSAMAGEITKKSGVNRTNVYDALERLIEKGLVTFVIEANRKVFEAVNPQRLLEILDEKKQTIKTSMQELQEKYQSSKSNETATIFKGRKGLKAIFEDVLNEKKTIYIYGSGKFLELFPNYAVNWSNRREKLKIQQKILYSESLRKKRSKLKKQWKHYSPKFLPKEYEFPSSMFIYGDKVVTIIWGEPPVAFMIQSKEAVKSNMNFFNLLWGIAKH